MARKAKPTSGGARLIASGRKPVLLGLQPTQMERIQAAAAIDNRPVTQFLIHHGLMAAEKILQKSSKNT